MILRAAQELMVPLIFKHIPMATYEFHPINQTSGAMTEFNIMLLGWCMCGPLSFDLLGFDLSLEKYKIFVQ